MTVSGSVASAMKCMGLFRTTVPASKVSVSRETPAVQPRSRVASPASRGIPLSSLLCHASATPQVYVCASLRTMASPPLAIRSSNSV